MAALVLVGASPLMAAFVGVGPVFATLVGVGPVLTLVRIRPGGAAFVGVRPGIAVLVRLGSGTASFVRTGSGIPFFIGHAVLVRSGPCIAMLLGTGIGTTALIHAAGLTGRARACVPAHLAAALMPHLRSTARAASGGTALRALMHACSATGPSACRSAATGSAHTLRRGKARGRQ